MKFLFTISIFILGFICNAATMPKEVSNERVHTAPIIDLNFDRTSESMKARVKYKNGCVEPWAQVKGIKKNKLILAHLVKILPNYCTQAIELNWVNFDLTSVPAGTYSIIDAHTGREIGIFEN